MLRNLVVAATIFLTCINSNVSADSFDQNFFYKNARYDFALIDDFAFFKQFDTIDLSDNGDGITLKNTNQKLEIRLFGTAIMDEPPPDTPNELRPQKYITSNPPLSVESYSENIYGHLLTAEAILTPGDRPHIYQIHIYVTSPVSNNMEVAKLLGAISRRLYIEAN